MSESEFKKGQRSAAKRILDFIEDKQTILSSSDNFKKVTSEDISEIESWYWSDGDDVL